MRFPEFKGHGPKLCLNKWCMRGSECVENVNTFSVYPGLALSVRIDGIHQLGGRVETGSVGLDRIGHSVARVSLQVQPAHDLRRQMNPANGCQEVMLLEKLYQFFKERMRGKVEIQDIVPELLQADESLSEPVL